MRRWSDEAKAMGKYLKTVRKWSGKTQSQVAADVGVHQVHVCGWELGNRVLKERYIPALASSLGVTEQSIRDVYDKYYDAEAARRSTNSKPRVNSPTHSELVGTIGQLSAAQRSMVMGYIHRLTEDNHNERNTIA